MKKATYAVCIGSYVFLTGCDFKSGPNLEVVSTPHHVLPSTELCITNRDDREISISSIIINKRKTPECEFFNFDFFNNNNYIHTVIQTIKYMETYIGAGYTSYNKKQIDLKLGDKICFRTNNIDCGDIINVMINNNTSNIEYNIDSN